MKDYLYAGILAKTLQNTHIGGKWTWQGGHGPICRVSRCHLGAARPHKWRYHVTDPWEKLYKAYLASIQCRFDQ
jgi:hypothetical protein